MDWYYWALVAVGINWGAPLLTWLYPLLMMAFFKDFTFEGFHGPFAKFALATRNVEPWHAKLWKDWSGVGSYGFMCYKPSDSVWMARTMVHESCHCWQFVILGLLQPILYIGHSAFIFFFQKSKHAYLDNYFERMARKHAGQQVDIPPAQWSQGPDDRWPWW
jgi:hypothetical protein